MKIKTLYLVHHSHTDIGYTDLQERVLDCQVNHIRYAIELLKRPENKAFRWNCETYYCVERFLNEASAEEKKDFFDLAREKRIGISANYLNFNDLADASLLDERLSEVKSLLEAEKVPFKTAMCADINGISMGQRDAMLNNGVEFLFTNIHTHHGMYPLYRNQTAYWWENAEGKRLLVWNGEHYMLGNTFGIMPAPVVYYMTKSYFGEDCHQFDSDAENVHSRVGYYLNECEESGYPYDFIVSSIGGVFSDNAPPNDMILRVLEAYGKKYDDVKIEMVSLEELYEKIAGKLTDIPTYHGDLTDWWANGVGSTPYPVKHYREAQRLYHLCGRLDKDIYAKYPELARTAQDNMFLYAEHTWGHSATVTNPYDTMVINLDIRKTSYASKAHEASALMLNRVMKESGGNFYYYNSAGEVRAVNTSDKAKKMLVEFYVETVKLDNAKVVDLKTGSEMKVQLSSHPRGIQISFTDDFNPHESKEYSYEEIPDASRPASLRHAFVGAERVRDIVNDYETKSYPLPHRLENEWFRISYEVGEGFTSFYDKKHGRELMKEGYAKFFTPVYERTEIREGVYADRAHIGRNIRGIHAKLYQGELNGIKVLKTGDVFTEMQFDFILEGTTHCDVVIKIYYDMPRVDFKLRTAKTISEDIESIFMPLSLDLGDRELYFKKGTEPFKPGVDQIPGTCMEYYMSDYGVAYAQKSDSVLINSYDVPLLFMGELKHHEITLCDGKKENNERDLYSWVMNNTWETNFKMDLSGFSEFCYSLELSELTSPKDCFSRLEDNDIGDYSFITK